MSVLTGVLFAALFGYVGGWMLGRWEGNFPLLLLILTLVTLAYWLAERFYFAPRRLAAADAMEASLQARNADLVRQGVAPVPVDLAGARGRLLSMPWWLDWTAGLFPVILIVFVLRSFLFEPFKIPSGSMIPTLLVGDLILVNKFHYGIRLPVIDKKIIPNHDPARGDVMVFHYPDNPSVDYIKRVVGVPGDEVSYLYAGKELRLNGEPVPTTALPDYYDEDNLRYAKQFTEKLGPVEHRILQRPDRLAILPDPGANAFPHRENCRYDAEKVVCKVPEGHYFMMGDNRDDSQDSRYWGFVPDQHIVGKAFLVWMNFHNLKRIGTFH